MSERKRAIPRISQISRTPQGHNPITPLATSNSQLRHKRTHPARSTQKASGVKPSSARGILRRLAKITAPTTKRRIVTPTSIAYDKENLPLEQSYGVSDDHKKPIFARNVDVSLGEEDSEILVAPTPSALFQYSDDEVDQEPTLTFLKEKPQLGRNDGGRMQTQVAFTPHSDSAIYEEDIAENGGENSTFLTERGRRAISEEPTRMSRYSFGSIRMSDFGTELEIRRESDRQKKLAELEAQDDYENDNGDGQDNILQMGGETENLHDLHRSPSVSSENVEETTHMPIMADNSFHFELAGGSDLDEPDNAVAGQKIGSARGPVPADSIVEIEDEAGDDDEDGEEEEAASRSASASRRQTLLESVVAAAKPRTRKRLKMNRKGNMVPSLPSSLIRWIANQSQEKAGKRKIPLGKDHMKALEQATEWFFEQVGDDLETFANHSKRKKSIDTDDVLLLMRRQRVLRGSGDLQAMAKQWLPRETWKDLEFPSAP